jgi:predicted nucleotidyltransferase
LRSPGAERILGSVLERLRRALDGRPEVLEAYLFGSQARGDAQPHSDIDVAVYLDPARAAGYRVEDALAADLMAAVGSSRLDLVVLNRAPPVLYHRVLRDGIRLLARDLRATTVREGRALSRYCDFVPVLRRMDAQLQRRLREGEFGR